MDTLVRPFGLISSTPVPVLLFFSMGKFSILIFSFLHSLCPSNVVSGSGFVLLLSAALNAK